MLILCFRLFLFDLKVFLGFKPAGLEWSRTLARSGLAALKFSHLGSSGPVG